MLSPFKSLVNSNLTASLSVALVLLVTGQSIAQADVKEIRNSRNEVIKLDPTVPPAENFDLTDWSISIPVADKKGNAANVPETYLAKGLVAKGFFYTADDGGMVFRTPSQGPKTSKNTKYTRTELREMLRAGNLRIKVKGMTENNWGLSSLKRKVRKKLGAIGGTLDATLAVNDVTSTGDIKKLGRVVIGQIHAKDDEPVRLYYRKLPNNIHGSIYMAHEPIKGDEQWYELIGGKASNIEDPVDGIALDEVFSYRIDVVDSLLTVTIIRQGKPDVIQKVDMTESGYNKSNQYMYFKAGVYNQNNTADEGDFTQATFYQLENKH